MTCRAWEVGRSRWDHQRVPKHSSLFFVSWGPPASALAATIGRRIWRNTGMGCGCLLWFWVVSLKQEHEVTANTDTENVLHMNPNLKRWGFSWTAMKDISFFNATCGFQVHTFINISSPEPLHLLFYPGILKDCENVQPMKICAREAADVAIWP